MAAPEKVWRKLHITRWFWTFMGMSPASFPSDTAFRYACGEEYDAKS